MTLIGVAIAVAALAVYVIAIGISLSSLSRKLGTLNNALRGIRDQTVPVGTVIDSMLRDATAIEGDLDELLAAVTSLLAASPAPTGPASMQEAVAVARAAPTRSPAPPVRAAPPASMQEAVARARGARPQEEAPLPPQVVDDGREEPARTSDGRSGARRRRTTRSRTPSGSPAMSEAVAKARQRVGS